MFTCFESINEASNRYDQGYQNYWYDVDDDNSYEKRNFTFTAPEKESTNDVIFISLESYHKNMIPSPSCYDNMTAENEKDPRVDFVIYRNDEEIAGFRYYRMHTTKSIALSDNHWRTFEAGDTFKITVIWDWREQKVHRDYSVVVYAKQPIEIVDEGMEYKG